MKKKIKEDVKRGELACYFIGGFIALAGLILIAFGIVATYDAADGPIAQAEKVFIEKLKTPALDFRFFGLLIALLGILIIVIALLVNAKKTDRLVEKEMRRQARVNLAAEIEANARPAIDVIEVKPEEKQKDGD